MQARDGITDYSELVPGWIEVAFGSYQLYQLYQLDKGYWLQRWRCLRSLAQQLVGEGAILINFTT